MGGLLGFILSFEGSCITGSHNRRKCNVLAVGDKIQPLAGRALLVTPRVGRPTRRSVPARQRAAILLLADRPGFSAR